MSDGSRFSNLMQNAAALVAANRYAEALADYDAAIALQPEAADAHVDRAEALRRLLRYDEAVAACDRAIELQPELARAWHGKALLLLALGRYDEGWGLHEWRWFNPDYPEPQRLFPQPFWDGSPRGERILLVHAEQGLGDSIQFYRFVMRARQQGPVAFLVPRPLARLFATQPDAPMISSNYSLMPRFDVHCPMLSLPFLLGGGFSSAAYLRADPALVAEWRTRLPNPSGKRRVGIVWAGNQLHRNDHNRSIPLATMLAMLDPDVTVVSLQKDLPEIDRATLREAAHVLDLSEILNDFADTAAVIAQLDLVISVCTSVAHLAGALGVPVWVLLPTPADWRWQRAREDSPWYASARLFRQDTPGDWSGVSRRVRDALKGLTAS